MSTGGRVQDDHRKASSSSHSSLHHAYILPESLKRLFNSPWFDVAKAIHYLTISNQPIVIANVLHQLDRRFNRRRDAGDIDPEFQVQEKTPHLTALDCINKLAKDAALKPLTDYLPLLLLLYLQKINNAQLRDIFHYFLIDGAIADIDFAANLLFLLDSHTTLDCRLVANEKLRFSSSVATTALNVLKGQVLGNIETSRATGEPEDVLCVASPHDYAETGSTTSGEILKRERKFVAHLVNISRKLGEMKQEACPREEMQRRLVMELTNMNFSLPGRLWMPGVCDGDHHVVRIPPQEALLLNSKERVPYLIYVEIVRCADKVSSPVPKAQNTTSCENLFIESLPNIHRAVSPFSSSPVPPPVSAQYDASNTGASFCPGSVRKRLEDYHNQQLERLDIASFTSVSSTDASDPSISSKTSPENMNASFEAPSIETNDLALPSTIFLTLEDFDTRKARIRESSPYGRLENWDLVSVIVKANDNVVQESLAVVIICEIKEIFEVEGLPLWLCPYRIQPTSQDSGIIETVPDAISIHQLKKYTKSTSLLEYFEKTFTTKSSFESAIEAFISSCSAYSIVCYLLQLKDRHNGNILIDKYGHVIHIDYGFFLASSPGMQGLNFEQAPFKLSDEFIQVINATWKTGDSPASTATTASNENLYRYKSLMRQGFLAIKKHSERLTDIIQIMLNCSLDLPCLNRVHQNGGNPQYILEGFKARLHMTLTEQALQHQIENLVSGAKSAWTTPLYDKFQYWTNGIL